MAQLVVRDLGEAMTMSLQRRAERHGRSMEAEVRDILCAALAADAPGGGLGTRIAERFAEVGLTQEEYEAFRQGTEACRQELARHVGFGD